MGRFAALIFVCGAALAKPDHAKQALHVRSIDLGRRYVVIELTGISHAPAPNLFTFTDVRDRHYVALNASCDKEEAALLCQLQIPDGYHRHELAKLELHMGGLHSRTIAAPEGEIAAAWAAAVAPSPSPMPSPSPRPSPSPSPRPRK